MNNEIFFFLHSLIYSMPYIKVFAVYFPYLVILGAFLFLLFRLEVLAAPKPFAEFKKRCKEIAFVFFSGIFAWLLAASFKLFFKSARPFDIFPNIRPLFSPADYSFPSGHATFFMALAVSLFFIDKKVGCLFMFFALIIGLARVAAGVHFPIDILGGFIFGFAVAYLLKKFIRI
jgi:membrane-associated phospholipid phosphatase